MDPRDVRIKLYTRIKDTISFTEALHDQGLLNETEYLYIKHPLNQAMENLKVFLQKEHVYLSNQEGKQCP